MARAAPTQLSVSVDMSVLETSMNGVRQHVAFVMGLFHLAHLSRVSQAGSRVEISLLLWPMAFHCVGLPHLGSIYPDRSPKEDFLPGWIATVTPLLFHSW